MEVCRRSSWLLLLLGVSLLATTLQGVQGDVESEGPSESECRPYIEKALKGLETGEGDEVDGNPGSDDGDSKEDIPTVEITTDDSEHHDDGDGDDDTREDGAHSTESVEQGDDRQSVEEDNTQEDTSREQQDAPQDGQSVEEADDTKEENDDSQKAEASLEDEKDEDDGQEGEDKQASAENEVDSVENHTEAASDEDDNDDNREIVEETVEKEEQESVEVTKKDDDDDNAVQDKEDEDNTTEDNEDDDKMIDNKQDDDNTAEDESESKEAQGNVVDDDSTEEDDNDATGDDKNDDSKSTEDHVDSIEAAEQADGTAEDVDSKQAESAEDEKTEDSSKESGEKSDDSKDEREDVTNEEEDEDEEEAPVEELSFDIEIPTDLRPREHVEQLLKLDDESSEIESTINRIAEITLRELKKLYENAIKPLEVVYKYRDLSNRHFGDAEIFSKPLILFMGPWSGGKSSIINYLLDNEYNDTSLRTGAEPSPAYFNILMHGDEAEVIDGTQLAADFTFSGLQKFGQGLEERLRGVKLPNKLLEKVNIVEIPGILEVRKQVSRVFPFNDACQWFIDRADIIFLVYDPSKLDVGPETEAILDQLKGREHQTRIVLNKADQVKPEELMRVQGALIWNISPLMSSAQPPIMYTTSLWSRPYESWAPVKLLQAQERAFLRDLRSAVDKRIENKIASARRFAVRVRNHAKMVDCYLTTYYNHKSVFGNRKLVADEIIEHPQDYHIYEGLSTLTNISRYDLPDPDVYKDFFKLNPLYDFQQLSATCTYFRGCPINRLDIAIAYDLPELVGRHRKLVDSALTEANNRTPAVPGS